MYRNSSTWQNLHWVWPGYTLCVFNVLLFTDQWHCAVWCRSVHV